MSTKINPKDIQPTPLIKRDSKQSYDLLKSEGFTDAQIVKIFNSYKYLPTEKLEELNTMYQEIKDNEDIRYNLHNALLKLKNPNVAHALSALGIFGADRFYIGDKSSGITKACTLGVLCIFWVYDIFTIGKRTRYLNFLKLRKVMGFEDEEFNLEQLNK